MRYSPIQNLQAISVIPALLPQFLALVRFQILGNGVVLAQPVEALPQTVALTSFLWLEPVAQPTARQLLSRPLSIFVMQEQQLQLLVQALGYGLA